jgi:anti-sigma-K factor RskA
MARELSRRELDDLLGVYALDAVDGDERAQVEAYLEREPAARARVAEYREATALLTQPVAEAPDGLWQRIEASLGEHRAPRGATVVAIETRRTRTRRRIVAGIAAAAAAVLIALLGVKVVQQDDRIDQLANRLDDRGGGVLAAARNAIDDPRAERVSLRSPDGSMEARVVLLPDGEGYVLDDNLATLVPGRTYQLWALVGDRRSPRVISAGVLGADPGVTAFNVAGPVVGFAITDEVAPGVVSSVQPPLLQGDVS